MYLLKIGGLLLQAAFAAFSSAADINYDWTILKNRKAVGTIQPQNVRKQSKPRIVEMDSPGSVPGIKPQKSLITELNKPDTKTAEAEARIPEPEFTIVQDPPNGHPEFMVAEVKLPEVKLASALTLDVGEDRILLETRSRAYKLDIYLPYNIDQDGVGAQFNKNARILTVTMPVQPLIAAS